VTVWALRVLSLLWVLNLVAASYGEPLFWVPLAGSSVATQWGSPAAVTAPFARWGDLVVCSCEQSGQPQR